MLTDGIEDTVYSVSKEQLLAGFTDADQGETETLEIQNIKGKDANGITVGEFALNENSTGWSFIANENFNGVVNIEYEITDGTADPIEASNSFTIAEVNDKPELIGLQKTMEVGEEDEDYTFSKQDLLVGVRDVETDRENLNIFGIPSANNGSISYNENTETYKFTPQKDFSGAVNLQYTVVDEDGGQVTLSNTFTLTDTNDAPVIVQTPDVFTDLKEVVE